MKYEKWIAATTFDTRRHPSLGPIDHALLQYKLKRTPEDLQRLRLPTLVIGHGRDLAHPLAHAEMLAGLIPGARLVSITPKAVSRDAYVADFRNALAQCLQEIPA